MATGDNNKITVKSKFSVKATLDLIESNIKSQNGVIFCRIDQRQAAETAGLIGELDDNELLLFGNPKVGTGLMIENGSVSFELPLRAASWKKDDIVYLSVSNPSALEVPYGLTAKKEVLQKMTENIMQMIKQVRL
jgi:uncharacterized protein (DUF302 family)